jgi:hypothetical protein
MSVRSTAFASFLITILALPAAAEPIIALGRGNIFYSFDSASPGAVITLGAASGLAGGEALVGIDFRPANNVLYALSDQSRLYTISFGGTTLATQVGSSGAFTLNGMSFGFDFNPMADRIRVVSDLDQNLRLNPDTGALTAVDTPLAYAAGDTNAGRNPTIVAAAYTNNFLPSPRATPGTTLFVLDSDLNILATQDPPNAGILNTIGAAGNPAFISGFDISGATGSAFASWAGSTGNDLFFMLNLATGAPTVLGTIGTGQLGIVDISVNNPVPEPSSLSLFAVAAGVAWLVRRRRQRRYPVHPS